MSAFYNGTATRPLAAAWLLLASAGVGAGCGEAQSAPLEDSGRASRVYIEAFSSWENAASDAAHPLIRFEDPRGTVYSLTRAQLGVASIRFEFSRMRTCADIDYQGPQFSPNLECAGRWLILKGPFRSELRTQKERAFWRIPALDYRHVEVHVAPISTLASSAQSSSLSWPQTVQARASFEADNAIRELNMDFRFHATLRAAIDAPLHADEVLTLRLDVANWLARIPVSDCLKRGILGEPDAPTVLDADLDAPSTAAVFDMTEPQDCADAQARFRINLLDSLRTQIDAAEE